MTVENRKIYRGLVGIDGAQVLVTVVSIDGAQVTDSTTEPLNHIVCHSPDGFSWGFHGSGPAELAHCLLVDYLSAEVEPAIYQQFKAEVIAKLPMDDGWMITAEYVEEWLKAIGMRRSEIEHPITDLDVLDEEIEQLKAVVRCEVCNYGPIDATQMLRDESGAWLCWPCSRGENR